jgi:hypothetical protein
LVVDDRLLRVIRRRIASEAYNVVLRSLGRTLSKDEFHQIRETSSIQQLYNVATSAQNLVCKNRGAGRVQNFVTILDHYSGVLDILSLVHAEYSCLVWGTIKWLLRISMDYYNLLERLSIMLEEIGHNLPRILLYQQILPTSRMSDIISQLYAAIVEFLHGAIEFFHRRTIRRYFSALWAPFELKFKNTVDKIQRLQNCVENDARATALVQQQMQYAEFAQQLRELNLVTQHTLRSIREVKQQQTVILLVELRQYLLSGFEEDSTYQKEMMETYHCPVDSKWETWITEETRHVSFHRQTSPGLYYVQTETMQPAIAANLMSRSLRTNGVSHEIPLITLFWSPDMTKLSALVVMVFQVLERHSETLLYQQAPDFYSRKFRRQSISFEYLWQIFVEMIAKLPRLRIYMMVPSTGSEASAFVMMFIDLYQARPPTALSIVIYHTTDAKLSDTPITVELDNAYDIDPEFSDSEAFSKVAMLELGLLGRTTQTMRYYVWSTLWATLRYDMMLFTFHLVLRSIKVEVANATGSPLDLPSDEPTWQWRNSQAKRLKRRIITFLQQLPYDIPLDVFHHLRRSIHQIPQGNLAFFPPSNTPHIPSEPISHSSTQADSMSPGTRSRIWNGVEKILETTIAKVICPKTRSKLVEVLSPGVVPWNSVGDLNETKSNGTTTSVESNAGLDYLKLLDLVGKSVFLAKNWDPCSLDSTLQTLQEGLVSAMELGTVQTRQWYILTSPILQVPNTIGLIDTCLDLGKTIPPTLGETKTLNMGCHC